MILTVDSLPDTAVLSTTSRWNEFIEYLRESLGHKYRTIWLLYVVEETVYIFIDVE